ncbi:MAG: YlxR family protein [Desulfotalea sp.]
MAVRTCVVCSIKCDKKSLNRYVWDGEKPSLDANYIAVGRGAYCCSDDKCYSDFMKNHKKWSRIFRL